MTYLHKVIILLIVFFFATGFSFYEVKKSSPEKDLQQLANLYLSLTKIAKKTPVEPIVKKIKGLQTKQEIATFSTKTIDDYVLRTKKRWLKICDSLLIYTHNNKLDALGDDALFGSLLASVSLSQADIQYSAKSINIAKDILTVYPNIKIEESTIGILTKAPSLKWIFDSFALERSERIVSPERNYVARLLIVEYIRIGDIQGANYMLNKLSEYNINKKVIVELKTYVDDAAM